MTTSRPSSLLLLLSLIGTILLSTIPTAVQASSGDQSLAFRTCVHECTWTTGCARASPESEDSTCSTVCGSDQSAIPMSLKITQWDCQADCQYLCMWELENHKTTTAATEKYFGKWPFIRLAGMQEPASVALSILNMLAVLHCLVMTVNLPVYHTRVPFVWLWKTHLCLSANAWFWSAVFHSRDTRITERFDYFSAGAVVAFNLYLTIVRVFNIKINRQRVLIAVPLLVFYIRHVIRMNTILFDYGWHVTLCVIAGAVQSVLWLVWAFKGGRHHSGRSALLLFVVLVNAAVLLEILDFPPFLSVLDAHALWHATTVPLAYVWFRFIKADVAHCAGGDGKEQATLKAM